MQQYVKKCGSQMSDGAEAIVDGKCPGLSGGLVI